MTKEMDLLVIGAGPAGLCTAISGASEGLRTTVLDSGLGLGGQARESAAIENYPGFPGGVTGEKLMTCFVRQASDFQAHFVSPTHATDIKVDGKAQRVVVQTDDYEEYVAKAVMISIGVQYRRHEAKGIGSLMGRGVYYGAPVVVQNNGNIRRVAIIGGANSAGQAAVRLSQNENTVVYMYVRRTLDVNMSQYLIDRIRNTPNIIVCENCEVTEVFGHERVEGIAIKDANAPLTRTAEVDTVCVFIGAIPKTRWMDGTVQLDENKYILTGTDTVFNGDWIEGYKPLPFETSLPGVFAAGDVRSGSVKRVSVAAGEGASALKMIHRHMERLL